VKTTQTFQRLTRIVPFLMALIATMGVIGCAALGFGPKYGSIKNDIAPVSAEKGRIVFYRVFDEFPMWKYPIILDGKKVGTGYGSSIFYVDVDPGRHLVIIPSFFFPGVTDQDITISKNETIYVRSHLQLGWKPIAELVSSEQAMAEIDELEFLADPNR
jgi:hypothetical protein